MIITSLGVAVEASVAGFTQDHPVIVYRYPSRSDDRRTLIATVLPDHGYIYSKGYVHGLRLLSPADSTYILALLAYLNSFTADWWTRRFVDRHMTQPVLANLPLPGWTEADIRVAAAIASELLARGGTSRLAGRRDLIRDASLDQKPDADLLASLEMLVAAGFGLSQGHVAAILTDFSDEGCPPALRTALGGRAEADP